MKQYNYTPVLTIAGFDGSGGAGIQADIKTFSALGCYAASVLTALPVQNTQGVRNIYPVPIQAVADQIRAVLDDIFPKAIKIGMVHNAELAGIIIDTLAEYPPIPIVFDPVMVATSGHRLIEEDTISTIIERLLPIAEIITPNMDETSILAKIPVRTLQEMEIAGTKIKSLGTKALLMKGGHQETKKITSVFVDADEKTYRFETLKFETNNTHGSGCTLSSAIAAYIAQGKTLLDAVTLAQQYVYQAIKQGKDVVTGKGNGPLNHFFHPQKLIKNEMV